MNKTETGNQLPAASATRIVLVVAAIVIIIAGLKGAREILVPSILSVFIAILCSGPLSWMRRKGIPTFLAVGITIVSILGVGAITGALIGNAIKDFRSSPSEEKDNGNPTSLKKKESKEESEVTSQALNESSLVESANNLSDEIYENIKTRFPDFAAEFEKPILAILKKGPETLMGLSANLLTELGGLLTNALLILLTILFIFAEASSFPAKLRLTRRDPDKAIGQLNEFINKVNSYMAIKGLLSLATGVTIGLSLWLLKIEQAMLLGLLAFLLNFIPSLGSIIAALPAFIFALLPLFAPVPDMTEWSKTQIDAYEIARASEVTWIWIRLAIVAGVYLGVNFFIGNIIEPRYLGQGMDLSTLVVFLSMIFWGWVLGPVGMLLSVPLTVLAKIAFEGKESTRWLAVWLGPTPETK